jgi:hypothetical protein
VTRIQTVEHRFVEEIPDGIAEATLYISIPYATAVHRCLCGCGCEVTTPLAPPDWRLTYDGETVSLCPSVGRWGSECQSHYHYWITRSHVRWAPKWSREQIDAGRRADTRATARYYDGQLPDADMSAAVKAREEYRRTVRSIWTRLCRWLRARV